MKVNINKTFGKVDLTIKHAPAAKDLHIPSKPSNHVQLKKRVLIRNILLYLLIMIS